MGAYWLNQYKTQLQNALGSKLKLYEGYESRSRSSGGFDGIWGILMHHDADPTDGDDDAVIDYEYDDNGTGDQPIGNFHVQRDGDIWWGAAGASNHAGKGGPVTTSRGTIPQDAGNKYLIGIEASNNGTGEIWGSPIMESYLKFVTVLCQILDLDPLKDIYGHWTWCQPSCPGRKIDPAGPATNYPEFGGTSGAKSWNMEMVRNEIASRMTEKPPEPQPEPEPEDKMTLTQADIDAVAQAVKKILLPGNEASIEQSIWTYQVTDPITTEKVMMADMLRSTRRDANVASK